jgi:thiamine-monophosphate kinase
MPERDLISYVRALGAEAPHWLRLGIGDDAAEVALPGGESFVVSADMLVAGVHCRSDEAPQRIAAKAVARAHSDTAAMAARPLCTLVTAALPGDWDDDRGRQLCQGLWSACSAIGAPLIGGDVSSTDGPLVLSVTALATPGPAGVITRAGARVGDAVCVTGKLGGSLLGRHLTFSPRIPEALALVESCNVHAMIDVSDGLSTDLLHIAEESGVGVEIRGVDVPVSAAAAALSQQDGRSPLEHALHDGEDYELLFCLAPPEAERLAEEGVAGVEVSIIGRVIEGGDTVLLRDDGTHCPLRASGWEHGA